MTTTITACIAKITTGAEGDSVFILRTSEPSTHGGYHFERDARAAAHRAGWQIVTETPVEWLNDHNKVPVTPLPRLRNGKASASIIQEGEKRCSKCETWLPVGSFSADPWQTSELSSACKSCRTEAVNRKQAARHQEATHANA